MVAVLLFWSRSPSPWGDHSGTRCASLQVLLLLLLLLLLLSC
jgi:hypothetical protein